MYCRITDYSAALVWSYPPFFASRGVRDWLHMLRSLQNTHNNLLYGRSHRESSVYRTQRELHGRNGEGAGLRYSLGISMSSQSYIRTAVRDAVSSVFTQFCRRKRNSNAFTCSIPKAGIEKERIVFEGIQSLTDRSRVVF